MNYQSLFGVAATRPVRAGVVGVGEFGVSLAARDRRLEHLKISALADLDVERACERLVRAGLARDELAVCDSVAKALAALESGKRVIAADASILPQLPLDVLVDATGDPETAARTADAGIRNGKHVVLASKEADSVIGPVLYRKARAAGLVYCQVDGDQPSLLIKLVAWARELGLEVVAAGKASEYDFVYDPAAETVSTRTKSVRVPEIRAVWDLPDARRAGGDRDAGEDARGAAAEVRPRLLRDGHRRQRHRAEARPGGDARAGRAHHRAAGSLLPARRRRALRRRRQRSTSSTASGAPTRRASPAACSWWPTSTTTRPSRC